MAINKRQKKNWKKKKGQRRKDRDPMLKKEWYYLRAPAPFNKGLFGFTCVNRKSGMSKQLFSPSPPASYPARNRA